LELEAATMAADFWSQEGSQDFLRELSGITGRLDDWERVCKEMEELDVLDEMLREDGDVELQKEFETRANELRRALNRNQLRILLNEEYDAANAILTVHAGSGGLDSQDWAEMLLRMYLRWAERDGFKTTAIEASSDEEAGIKSATILVEGDYAYGYLKSEKGVHRLVRISPFDSAHRRHTSFASVGVSPELPESVEVAIRPEDLRVDTFRASGAGGQYVNRTDSAVRITHIPTGIVVSCQNERSQHMNRQVSMQVLKSKLYERAMQERSEELAAVVGDKKESTWGSQIRSYVLHPYTLVKDHRTGTEKGNVQAILDGDIDGFIMAYLRWRR
jgi:peptide chain release factor 2